MQNLGEFLKGSVQKNKGRVAFEIKRGFRSERFFYEDVYSLALKTAIFLKEKGLKKGDRVAVWSQNMPEYPILYFACWLLGVVVVPIDVRTTQETLKVFLTKAKCVLGFKSKFVPGTFGSLVSQSSFLEDLVDLVRGVPQYPPRRSPSATSEVTQDDIAEIAFTSGTTGTPKGVVLTHGNFISDVEALTLAFPLKKEYKALSLLPLSHAFEQVAGLLAPFQSGMKITYLERANSLTILKAMKKGKITLVVLVPQALQLLMNGIEQEVEKQGKEKLWSVLNNITPSLPMYLRRLLFRQVHKTFGGGLQFFGCGSAPLNLKLAQKWENLGINVFEGYGATETTAALTINSPFYKRLGSVGRVLPGMEVRIDPNNNEILAKGPNISQGYYQDVKKTKQAFQNSWYKTGDIGAFDKDGYLYITGRESFRIVLQSGQKVYPEDVEKKLNAHPLVIESCVIGVEREEGERVHAVVITKYPNKLDEIIRQTNQKLSSHEQILEASLWREDDFPRTPILKIDRKKVQGVVSGIETKKEKEKIETEDKLKKLISQVANIPPSKIQEKVSLATDLGLDSLQRVELLSLIEQEFAVSISETKINPQTRVLDMRKLIKEAPLASEELPLTPFMYSKFMMKLRAYFIQHIFFGPLHGFFVPLEIKGKENLKDLPLPCIFYFNHVGIYDAVCVVRALQNSIREKLVIAVLSDLWSDYRRRWVEIHGGGFPFDRDKRIKVSLELMGDFLDRGFSILMAPEGEFSPNGKLLKFKPGIGFMAVEMQVPVVPFKIDPSYYEIFPPMGGSFWENIPKKRKKIKMSIGKPMRFAKETSYERATKKMQEAIERLRL